MELNLNKYKSWLEFLKKLRHILEAEGCLEVFTPSLVPSGAMEAHLDAFKVGDGHYLPTSPEFALKKLWLSGEFNSIFEISPSFRDNELGDSHLAEFTMLEFYVSDYKISDLKEMVKRLFRNLSPDSEFLWGEICLVELFQACTGFELKPDSDSIFLKNVCSFHNIEFQDDFSWNDLYQLIFINLLEPSFSKVGPIFVENYPPQIAALAKINESGWAERVEVYFKGLEIGNGYNELFDEKELLRRWILENEERARSGKEPHPIDKTFIKSHKNTEITQGVGIAIGLERLFYTINKINADNSIKTWPY